jgi:hypothetical protein
MRRFTCDREGCRVVQAALDKGVQHHQRTLEELLKELWLSVVRASTSPHGNYVIQKIVDKMPPDQAKFIAHELYDHAEATAKNRYGCRILCRLLEHLSQDQDLRTTSGEDGRRLKTTVDLLDALLSEEAGELCRDEFAHYVMESVVEHGVAAHRAKVLDALEREMSENVHNRTAMYTLGTVLQHCSSAERARLSEALQACEYAAVMELTEHPAGTAILTILGLGESH